MHEPGAQNTSQSISEISTFTRNTIVDSNRKKNRYNAVSITLSAPQEVCGSHIDITIECAHGITGSIAVYDATGKEDLL